MPGGLVQSQAQLRAMAVKVGIPNERSDDIKAAADTALVTSAATLRPIVNKVGYYNEKADQLVAGGVTFVP